MSAIRPSVQVPVRIQTAYEGRENTIEDPDLKGPGVAWQSELLVPVVTAADSASYRRKSKPDFALAEAIIDGAAHVTRAIFADQGFRGSLRPAQHGVRTRNQRGSRKAIHPPNAAAGDRRNFARSIDRLLPADFKSGVSMTSCWPPRCDRDRAGIEGSTGSVDQRHSLPMMRPRMITP